MTRSDGNSQILVKILEEARATLSQNKRFLAVFDLDSTLFDLSFRIAKIVDGFADDPTYRLQFPKECLALKSVEIRGGDWGLGEPLKRLDIFEKTHPEFWQALHDYWRLHFFTGNYFQHDELIPGALEFVLSVQKLGADIMYLTARDVPRMFEASRKTLLSHGFPVNETTARLVLKPDEEEDDAYFKLEILKDEEKKYDRIWFFENEPVNTNLVAKNCPNIGIVFIETTHSGREQPARDVARIQHWVIESK